MKRRWAIIAFLVFLAGAGALALLHAPADLRSPYAVIGSTLLATIGWVIQYHNTRDLQRRQYTLQRIQEFRADKEYMQHKNNIRRYYPGEETIRSDAEVARHYAEYVNTANYVASPGTALATNQLPVLLSIQEILNFYEEIAYGIRQGNVDEETIKNTLSGIMILFERKVRRFVKFTWHRDHEHYEHLRWLINKWNWQMDHGQMGGERTLVPVEPNRWNSKRWSEGCPAVVWGNDAAQPWGHAAVDAYLKQLAAATPSLAAPAATAAPAGSGAGGPAVS